MSFNTNTTLRRRRANVLVRRSRTEGPAGQHLQRRQDNEPVAPGPPIIRPTQIPPPVPPRGTTLTQVRTLTTLPGTRVTSTTTTSKSSSSSRSTSSTSSTSSTPSVSTTSILSSPTDSITPTPTAVPLPTSSAGSNASNDPGGTAVNQRGGLSSGAIAGIAITVVVVLAAFIAFLVRRRMIANRAGKRDDWANRGAFSTTPPPPAMQQQSPGMMWNQSVEYGASPSATAAPFATTYRPESLTPGRGQPASAVPFQPNVVPLDIPQPVSAVTPTSANAFSPGPTLPVPGAVPTASKSLMVRCTFLPSMADELPIVTGEMISIVQEYDDGWALCRNASGQQGMVPLECLYETDEKDRNLKRASSITVKSN